MRAGILLGVKLSNRGNQIELHFERMQVLVILLSGSNHGNADGKHTHIKATAEV